MNLEHLRTLVYLANDSSESDRDIYLCWIGRSAELLSEVDLNQIHGGKLTTQLRSRIWSWLRQNANQIGLTSKMFTPK